MANTPRSSSQNAVPKWFWCKAVGAEEGMALYVDGGRGTTGRLSPFKAFMVDAAAVLLIAATAVLLIAVALEVVIAVLR